MEEAAKHPNRNVLTNALGIWDQVRIDIHKIKNDYQALLICSDGLHGYVHEDVLREILAQSISAEEKVNLLSLIHIYLEYLQAYNEDLYNYALNGKTAREATFEILKLFRLLRVFRVEELQSDYLNDKVCLLEFVEEGYNFWKRHQRFSVLFNAEGSTLQDVYKRQAVYRTHVEEIYL